MDYIKLILVLFSANGLWQLVGFVIKLKTEKRKSTAEIRNLNVQAESRIADNWIQWSQALEKRVKELESVAEENNQLKAQIEQQRKRICELEKKVGLVEKENEHLHNQILELTRNNTHE